MMHLQAILKRELRAHFRQPLTYAAMGTFLLLTGHTYYAHLQRFLRQSMAAMDHPSQGRDLHLDTMVVGATLEVIATASIFIVPWLTMHVWAEEKRTDTLELLLTLPLRDIEIVLGKWLAVLVAYAILLTLTLLYPLLTAAFVPLDHGPLVTGYAGTLLLGASLLAFGSLCSVWAPNARSAAITTWCALFLLWFINQVAPDVDVRLGAILTHLSLATHHHNFVRGVIATHDVVYFLLIVLVCLVLTLRALAWLRTEG
jgi:ABC-2 type transport system permease protein